MEFVLRDTRHLRGTTPQALRAPPTDEGHAIGITRGPHGPHLEVRAADGTEVHLPLDRTIDIEVLPERRCIGRSVDGTWAPCPHDAVADHFEQCPACHPLPDRECVFNPRCLDCKQDWCRAPHQLYLAFYGELPKVGMTRSARGDDRLVEQGADAYAFIALASDRSEARRLEDLVTSRLGIPQSRRAQEVLSRTARPVPHEAIENAYAALAPRIGALLGTAPGPLRGIGPHPGTWPLPLVPTLAGTEGHHAGLVLGAKGRHLFYRPERPTHEEMTREPVWALNLGAVVTHRIHYDAGVARTA